MAPRWRAELPYSRPDQKTERSSHSHVIPSHASVIGDSADVYKSDSCRNLGALLNEGVRLFAKSTNVLLCRAPQQNSSNKNKAINSFQEEEAAVKNPKELFVMILSHARQGAERSAAIYKELGEAAQNPEIQQALQARAFVSQQNLDRFDEAFKMIGEKPVNVAGRLHDTFVEDFRKELAEIQSPEGRRLYVLAKASHLSHMRTAEYELLAAAADVSGNHGVGVLLECCLADHMAFAERTRHLVRGVIEAKVAARAAG